MAVSGIEDPAPFSADSYSGSGSSIDAWSGSSVTAPPTVVAASSESASIVGVGGCSRLDAGSGLDRDTASSSSGPRKRGVKRCWKAGLGADSRACVSGRVSPLEEALQRYGDRASGPIIVPRAGLEFDSCEEAFDYYNLYSWEMGFGIRYGKNQTYRRDGEVYRNMQLLVCACGGVPNAAAKNSIKQGCPALMRLLRTDDDGWYIKEFVAEHNHKLSETCGEKKCWKSHRQIDPHTKELIKTLRANNVSLSKVYCILSSFFGSNNMSAVTKRALRSLSVQINREKSEDDVQKTVEVFNRLHEEDEGFANVVDLDTDGKIKTMMWTNGKSRHDYLCFGDAITFDTTYKTNKYNMPFGLFVGVNNHFQSVIFAGVLMRDETIESFEWVFTQFVKLMGGKAPKTILTDQCRAMEVALANKFPDVTHRWCKWHVFRTIKTELNKKYTKEFKRDLNKVCNHMLTPEEFEAGWAVLIAKYGLKNNVYMQNIYNNRQMWAKAYFRGKFCAKQTSTQRSESANHVLKDFVPPGATMHVFVEQYHKLLSDWNEKEDTKVHEDKLPLKESTTGWPIEAHAAEFYTKTMLGKFVEQMKLGAAYDVVEIIPKRRYRLDHVDASSREVWCRTSYIVEIREDGGYYQCECGLWEHMGMLCCHSIRVMMQLMVRKIPDEHLLRRWSKNGNKVESSSASIAAPASSLRMSRSFRNVSLSNKARELVNLGDLNIECYDLCYKGICALIEEVKSKRPKPDGLGHEAQLHHAQMVQVDGTSTISDCSGANTASWSQLHLGVKAPDVTRNSGRPSNARDRPAYECPKPLSKRRRRCRTCRLAGHNADQCPGRDPGLDNAREPGKCTRCRMPGHTRLSCARLAAAAEMANEEL